MEENNRVQEGPLMIFALASTLAQEKICAVEAD